MLSWCLLQFSTNSSQKKPTSNANPFQRMFTYKLSSTTNRKTNPGTATERSNRTLVTTASCPAAQDKMTPTQHIIIEIRVGHGIISNELLKQSK